MRTIRIFATNWKNYLLLPCISIFLSLELKAQGYSTPFISIDKDGYTNVREKPDGKSKIVGKVFKYQVFYFGDDDECGGNIANYSSSKWLPIFTDSVSGYVYKKNIMDLQALPCITGKYNLNSSSTKGFILFMNDSLKIAMEIIPFDEKAHKFEIEKTEWDGDEVYTIDEQRFYGTNNRLPTCEIKKIEINYKSKITILPKDKINIYYEPRVMVVYIGLDGELYLCIAGGGDAGQYTVWFSIVNDEIVHNSMEDHCW
jgi:hypothetical protein